MKTKRLAIKFYALVRHFKKLEQQKIFHSNFSSAILESVIAIWSLAVINLLVLLYIGLLSV